MGLARAGAGSGSWWLTPERYSFQSLAALAVCSGEIFPAGRGPSQ